MIRSNHKVTVPLLLFSAATLLFIVSILPKIKLESKATRAAALITFPSDHAMHSNYNYEWWYLNLLARTTKLDGSDQRDLSYVISFSKLPGSHNLLTSRYDNNSKSFRQSTDTSGNLVVKLNNGNLFVQFSKEPTNLSLIETPIGTDRKRIYSLSGRTINTGYLDLVLKERTVVSRGYNTPLLWGGETNNCQGVISVFAPNDTYYYSIPDLDITGTITDINGNKRKIVIGKAWIDHQWFNTTPPSDWKGHYWSNLHSTNSGDLFSPGPHEAFGFVTQYYNSGKKYTYWVKRNSDGTNSCGTNGSITINTYGSTNYPSNWTIQTPVINISGQTFSDNQIFVPPLGPKFIESTSYYSGSSNSQSITGLGFFETHLLKTMIIPTATPTVSIKPTPTPTKISKPSPTSSGKIFGDPITPTSEAM